MVKNRFLDEFGIGNQAKPIKEKTGGIDLMTTIKEYAKNYTVPATKNVSDLKELNTQQEIFKTPPMIGEDGKEFTYLYVLIDEQKYRVPPSVVAQIQAIHKEKPGCIKVRVKKTGEGLKTKYQVIPLD